MKTLLHIVDRQRPALPWEDGDNIPWDDPAFSARMLREHLNQRSDLASRRFSIIDEHVRWLHEAILHRKASRILDLCCGPGLYTQRLALLGHQCVGVDFSPASIAHARAAAGGSGSTYVEADVRTVVVEDQFELVMILWGQINVFRRPDAAELLRKARRALGPGGQLGLEPSRYERVKATGEAGPGWRSARQGLFSERPHLLLEEASWDSASDTSTTRIHVIDAESAQVTRHALSCVAYREETLVSMLEDAGFATVSVEASLGTAAQADGETFVVRGAV